MNKRPLCQILCFFFISFVGMYHRRYIPLCMALLFVLLIVLFIEHLYKKQYQYLFIKIILIIIMLFLGGYVALGERQVQQKEHHVFKDKACVTFQGNVIKKESKNQKFYYYLKDCLVQKGNLSMKYSNLILVLDQDKIQIGKTIYGTALVNDFMQARNEGAFDEEKYYKSIGISIRLKSMSIKTVTGDTKIYEESLYRLKKNLLHFYLWAMPKKEAGVLSVMLLGDKTYLDSNVKNVYQKTGIAHVLSISGLHISILGMGIFGLLRKGGRSYWFSGMISVLLVYSFGMMSGFHVAARRAVFMFLLSMAGKVIKRTYDAITAMALAAAITIITQPYLIDYLGFLFSYFAVIGVLIVGNISQSCIDKPYKIKDAVILSLSIESMILPLVALSNYEIPLYCVVINLVILPFMEAIIGLGIIGGMTGLLCPMIGKKIVWFVAVILRAYEWIGNFFSNLAYATYITGKPSELQIVIYFLCLGLCLCLVYLFRKKEILLIGFFLCMFLLILKPSQAFEIDVLDVGQGDGIFLHMGKDTNVFIDGGSTSQKKVGTYVILPFLKAKGVGKIDYWFVSHGDSDHISGLLEVMSSRYKIKNIMLSNEIVKDEAFEKIIKTAKKYKVQVHYMKQDDVLKQGDVSLKAVFPDQAYQNDDRNAKSLVLLLKKGNFKALFTGDISSEEEKRILQQTTLPRISFYKAAHHGSKYSNSKEFLKQIHPQVAAISCAIKNRYGHPGKEAIEHMQAQQTKIYYTMKQGQIKIYFDEKQDEKQKKEQDTKDEKNFYVTNYLNPLEVHFYPVLK